MSAKLFYLLNNHRCLALFTFLCLGLAIPDTADARLKIGLALSGGGARGAAHVGVLKELERLRIPIDYVAGTSVGAIIGGFYASGLNPVEIERIIIDSDLDSLFKDHQSRDNMSIRRKFDERLFQMDKDMGIKEGKLVLPSGLIQGQKLQLFLDKLLLDVAHIQDFDHLPIPFRAIVTDIVKGEAVALAKGNLPQAIRASMSLPSIFTTVKIDERILVDGGISNNMPVDIVKQMGADIVIAVDIGTPLLAEEKLGNLLGVTVQLTGILVSRTTLEQIKQMSQNDILIRPELDGFSSANFSDAAKIVPAGVSAAQQLEAALKPLALNKNEYARLIAARTRQSEQTPAIDFINLENDSQLAESLIRSRLRQVLGETLDFAQLEQDISNIYGLGIFESVTYDVIENQGHYGLNVKLVQKPWGPRYLQAGFGYSSDITEISDLNFSLGYTIIPANGRNGEWRSILKLGEESGLFTEYQQPFKANSNYYFNASLGAGNQLFNVFEDATKINATRVKEFRASLAIGREFSNLADARIGLNRFKSRLKNEFGPTNSTHIDGAEVFAQIKTDTLDHTFFPRSGSVNSLKWTHSSDQLGADFEYDQLMADTLTARDFGGRTLFLGARYYSTLSGTNAVHNHFRLGGLFELPGYTPNSLTGTDLYLLRSGYQT